MIGKRVQKPAKSAATQDLIDNLPLLNFDCLSGSDEILQGLAEENIKEVFPPDQLTQLRMELQDIQGFIRGVISKADDDEVERHVIRLNGVISGKVKVLATYSNGKLAVTDRFISNRPQWSCIVCSLILAAYLSLSEGKDGFFYIGCCPRCRTIFEKKNNRQAFCREYCQKNPGAKPRSGTKNRKI